MSTKCDKVWVYIRVDLTDAKTAYIRHAFVNGETKDTALFVGRLRKSVGAIYGYTFLGDDVIEIGEVE